MLGGIVWVSLCICCLIVVILLFNVVGESCIIVIWCSRLSILISSVFYLILCVVVLLISDMMCLLLVLIIVLINDKVWLLFSVLSMVFIVCVEICLLLLVIVWLVRFNVLCRLLLVVCDNNCNVWGLWVICFLLRICLSWWWICLIFSVLRWNCR